MGNKFSKKIKLGKLHITLLLNQVVVVFVGQSRVYVKTINLSALFNFKNPLYIFTSIAILLTIFTAFSPSNYNKKEKIDTKTGKGINISNPKIVLNPNPENKEQKNKTLLDEIKKDNLLKSTQTDFSAQTEDNKLKIFKHKVRKGEYLSNIAKQYGVSMDTICGNSNLDSYDFIREGAILTIPNKDGLLYTVKKGNSIISLAKKYNVSLEKILSQNNIKNFDFIQEGKTLFIPDARPQNVFSGFLWPTISRRITCGYGWRRNPFNKGYREFHRGLDIKAKYERVRSIKYGKVTYTGWLGGYGKAIIVAHPGNWKTLYAHLSRIYVKKGQYVKQGQFVGRSGNTGRSTGAHLHVELIKRGRHKNPYAYLKRR